MNDTLFQQALELARAGQKAEARVLLREVLQADRTNEMAWLWYSDCVDTLEERVQALEICLRMNPTARHARAGLLQLKQARVLDLGRTQPVFITAQPEGRAPLKPSPFLEEASFEDSFSSVFTVSPEKISPEEFEEIEARTEAFLLTRPDLSHDSRAAAMAPQAPADPWAALSWVPTEPRLSPRARKNKSPLRQKIDRLSAWLAALMMTLLFVLIGISLQG